ncbi:helix-hairpin-helix domain-containing protein [Paenibacillus mesophilus]|uniref:helix-hairpin-helix domain-containing protein n=1 Tax=Paenibacillus mesophilus TaxID=2582849 RepID=UPI001EE41917|nr:helix-hairpin-helix domain-containing protein [Paenibacillus mesophilus]
MDTGKNGLRTVAAAASVWVALALLLWLTDRLLHGGAGTPGDWPVRNAELTRLFDAQDRQEMPAAAPAPDTSAARGTAPAPGNAAGTGTKIPDPAVLGKATDLNRASLSELDKLPGIGPSKAKAIMEYRDKQGAFRTIEELKKVKGIGDKTFESLKPFITVEK